MIFWEEPDGELPGWSMSYALYGSSSQVLPPSTNSLRTVAGGGSSSSESGSSANEDGTTTTKSSVDSFTSSVSYSFSATGTYRNYGSAGWSVAYGTTTQSNSSSSTFSSSYSYFEGGTTQVDDDGSTIQTASAFAFSSLSSEEAGAAGESGTTVIYFYTSTNGPDWTGAIITQGGWDNSTPGVLVGTSDSDSNEEDNGAGDVVADPINGPERQTTVFTTAEGTISSWSTMTAFKNQLTIIGGVLQATIIATTVTVTYEETITLSDIPSVIAGIGYAPSRAKFKTCYRADRCYQLYEAGELYGFGHWCDVWAPVVVGCNSVSYDIVAYPVGGDESFTPGLTSSTRWSSWSSGGATYEMNLDTFNGADYPVISPAVLIVSPAAYGVMHYRSLELGDALYGSYTINVAASVTDLVERAERAVGFVAIRGAITQVATLNSADTLVVGGAGYTYTSAVVNQGGGDGIWTGDNSVIWQVGVYDYTSNSGGAPSTGRTTVTANATEVSPRGVLWTIAPQSVAFGGVSASFPNIFMEQPCAAPWPAW